MSRYTNSPKEQESQKSSGFRTVIVCTLLSLATGALSGYLFGKRTAKPKKTDIGDVNPEKGSGDDTEFKYRLAFLRCRQTLFRVAGNPACGTTNDDEIEAKAFEIQTKKRLELAREMIQRYCLTNPKDKDAVINAALNGCTYWSYPPNSTDKSQALDVELDGSFRINLKHESPESCQSIPLSEEPPASCLPDGIAEKTERRKRDYKFNKDMEAEQKQKIDSMVELIKNNKLGSLLENIDISKVISELRHEKIEKGLGKDLIDMLKRVDQFTTGGMGADARKKLGCDLMAFTSKIEFLSALGKDGTLDTKEGREENKNNLNNADVVERMYENDTLSEILAKLSIIAGAFEKIDESESFMGAQSDCFMDSYKK